MRHSILFLITLLATPDIFANVNYIDITEISSEEKYVSAFNYIKDNQQYYNHWTNVWTYNKPKEELIQRLENNYSIFLGLTPKNNELFLLLGDISHYLYNLDDTAYFRLAISNYDSSIKANPTDYRGYWFLGYHYALSNIPNSAVENFLKAQDLLPSEQPSDFWNDYAWATAVANMPSHCIYAMDKVKSILGTVGSFEAQLGQTINKRIVPVDRDKSYKKEDIWTASKGEKMTFTSRPLGIKILLDSTWDLSIHDYNNRQNAFIINPPTLKNKKGKEIHYTIAILMKAANDNEKLENYINNFVSIYPNKINFSFSKKYERMITYEIKDNTMYQDIGGGHLYMIGIERISPKYPGFLLENANNLPKGKTGEVTYYTASDCKDRFKGKIFYAIMLDSCEDINTQSLTIFKALFDSQIVIE